MYYGTPPIVTNGLVFYVDASNPLSYQSGSSAWYDITNPTVSGSLTGVGYDPNKKCLLFSSSSNSTCLFNNINIMNFNTGSFSIEVLVKLTAPVVVNSTTLWQKRVSTGGIGGAPGYQYRILPSDASTTGTILSVDNGTGNTNNVTAIGPPVPYYTFIHSVVMFNSSSLKLSEYRNGILNVPESNNSGVMTGSFYNNTQNFRLGKNDGNCLDAEYYFVKAYNGILSQTEVLQNYNATKTRVNLT